MQWLRLYDEIVDDPKICNMNEMLRWRYVSLLCIVSRNNQRGYIPCEEDILFTMRISKEDWDETKKVFIQKEIIAENEKGEYINGWFERQYESDDSSKRVKKYRQTLKTLGKTTNYLKHKQLIFERDNNKCVYCSSSKNLCLDHLIPLSRGGDNEKDNLVTACKECNSGKAGRLPSEIAYNFENKNIETMYLKTLQRLQLQGVTVTVTDQIQKQIQKQIQIQNRSDTDIEILPKNKTSSIKKPEEQKQKHGEYKNVLLTDSEYEKLKIKLDSKLDDVIAFFSECKEMKGYKYKSDYLALKKWGIDAYFQKHPKESETPEGEYVDDCPNCGDNYALWMENGKIKCRKCGIIEKEKVP